MTSELKHKCPVCGGNLVDPSTIFDGGIEYPYLICDGEVDGSGCEFFIIKPYLEQENILQKIVRILMNKPNPKDKYDNKVHDIHSQEFHQLAHLVTGIEWDFNQGGCCVKNCPKDRAYNSWTCYKHEYLIKEHFQPVSDHYCNFGGVVCHVK